MIVDVHTHIFPPEVLAHRERFLDGEPAFAAIYADANARMVTNAMLGLFKSNFNTRQEFLSSIGRDIGFD